MFPKCNKFDGHQHDQLIIIFNTFKKPYARYLEVPINPEFPLNCQGFLKQCLELLKISALIKYILLDSKYTKNRIPYHMHDTIKCQFDSIKFFTFFVLSSFYSTKECIKKFSWWSMENLFIGYLWSKK